MTPIERRPAAVAALSVSTQFENVGDAWLYRALLRVIRLRVATWVDLSRCPAAFADDLDVDRPPAATRVPGFAALLGRLLAHRLRGGTATYFLSPGGYHGELAPSALARAWVNTGMLAILRGFGVRICLVGTSYERLGPRYQRLLVVRGRMLHAHLVRDAASASVARAIGLRVDGVIPDLSFAHATAPPRSPPAGGDVALAFRGDQAPDQQAQVAAFAADLARAAPDVPRWRAIAQVARDAGTARAVAAAIAAAGGRVDVVEVAHDLDAAATAYEGCSHVVGNRLHALLLGNLAGCAPVAVVDPALNAKVLGTFTEIGETDRVVDGRSSDAAMQVADRLDPRHWAPIDARPFASRIDIAFDALLGPERAEAKASSDG